MASPATVSIIGLGYMGTALAWAFLNKRVETHVWNRTISKADALVEAGAFAHGRIQDCVQASKLVLVCLADSGAFAKAFGSVLGSNDSGERAAASMIGRNHVMVNYTTGPPQEVRNSKRASERMGFDAYLHGTIQAYPYDVKQSRANVVYSGPRETFNSLAQLLENLGTVDFIDEDPTSAALREAILMGSYYPMMLSFIQCAALEKKARPGDGTSAEQFLRCVVWPFVENVVKPSMREIATQIDGAKFASDGSGARLQVHATAVQNILKTFEEVGANDFLLNPTLQLMERGIGKSGGRDEELSALYNEI